MAPVARILCVAVTTAVAGFIAFGPMPQGGEASADIRVAIPSPVAAAPSPAAAAPALPAAPARKPRVSATLQTTTGTAGVSLTFDDGPDPRYTPRVLALLKKHNVKATFCLVGSRVRAYPALVRAIVRDGHTLCNHTMGHDQQLRSKSNTRIAADLAATNALIRRASGVTPKYFRAPGGNWSTRVRAVAADIGMRPLHWAVDPQDWRRPPAAKIVSTVRSTTRRGSVILLHDAGGDRSQTEAALKTLLPYLLEHYKLVAL